MKEEGGNVSHDAGKLVERRVTLSRVRRRGRATAVAAVLMWISAPTVAATQDVYDLVIAGGRVMDPASGLDSVLSVGIRGDSISVIAAGPMRGRRTIDARGLIVAPGFIDILSYAPREAGNWNKLADGVTTNLAMHGGTSDPSRWYAAMAARRPPLNYGASFFYTEARNAYVSDRYKPLPPARLPDILLVAEKALQEGALGVSFSLEYVPGISAEEILPMMRLARRYDVPVFFHARYSDMEPPGTNIEALEEILRDADSTGASVHIDHINSTGGTFSMARSLALIDSARGKGLDVTACVYPYTFWGTYLNSARFDAGWQTRFRISYDSLQLGGSTERLTASSFRKYRKLGKLAVAYAIPDADVEAALKSPYVMIGSDAILEYGYNNHPRASGTFSRTLGVYVREKRTIGLMDALAKMTILPARRLERSVPAMSRKGRLAVGADADVVVFDPLRVRDRSTVDHPERRSEGMRFVVVAGKMVMRNGTFDRKVRAGRPVRALRTRRP